jgi:hypothetical protein
LNLSNIPNTIEDTPKVNYFQLHGSITNGGDPISGYQPLFAPAKGERFKFLKDPVFQQQIPPVVFPWEFFSSSGEFISEDEFIFVKGNESNPHKEQEGRRLFNDLKSMWEKAKQIVEQADKISFVGLSMHEYLESGLRYLFQDFGKSKDPKVRSWIAEGTMDEAKPKEVQVVVANPDNEHFKIDKSGLHPASPCGKVADLLGKVAKNMKYVRSSSEDVDVFSVTPEDVKEFGITPRNSFEEFIEREMD